ncbi:hypothetical protein K469DRAFT_710361 [Zopfia rhizophila CBS 207.26]|uniref:Uncharacterized protein n=1 Tax=Zopfia rhizophila CBS 207.26 TaxID=1314779 RepID=A0A6A6DY68_9PEZI|nr:hypothetical protein K469DRAFT_710361 [Zopfia rhizophila CBS 207.26]
MLLDHLLDCLLSLFSGLRFGFGSGLGCKQGLFFFGLPLSFKLCPDLSSSLRLKFSIQFFLLFRLDEHPLGGFLGLIFGLRKSEYVFFNGSFALYLKSFPLLHMFSLLHSLFQLELLFKALLFCPDSCHLFFALLPFL